MMKVLRKQRFQREEIQQHFHSIQVQFLTFLRRLDGKQQVLDKFIVDFNQFSDQCPDMREDDQTKEELHQRVDILSDELWEIAEDRKEHAVEERKKIMDSGWVEFSLEYLTSCAQQMMQSEIDKFKGTIQLVHDYYHAVDEKLIPEAPESNTVDLLAEDAELPDVERIADGAEPSDINSFSYPRLDDFFKKALKAQVVPDVLAQSAAADAGKKGGAKGKDAKKGGAPDPEEAKPESIYLKEMKEAIKVEKSILRFRLTQIRNWALMRLKHQRELSLRTYQKLDDWIAVATKAENDAIEEVCDVLKDAIEDQEKIQDELRIKFMDFFVDKGILNYIEPPPEKLASMEESSDGKFNIPQLEALLRELQVLADADGKMNNRKVVELFFRKAQPQNTFGDVGGLPKEWHSFTRAHFEKLVRNLDICNTGSVDYRVLATCCVLLKTPIAQDADIEAMKKSLQHPEVTADGFMAGNFWFTKTEAAQDREYSHPFPRAAAIKRILFDLHSADGKVSIAKLGTILRAAELTLSKPGVATYGDILAAVTK